MFYNFLIINVDVLFVSAEMSASVRSEKLAIYAFLAEKNPSVSITEACLPNFALLSTFLSFVFIAGLRLYKSGNEFVAEVVLL